MPDVDLNDPNLDPAVQKEFRNRQQSRAQAASAATPAQSAVPDPNDKKLLSMIDSIGQLEINDKGAWDYHGTSSGPVFLKRMKENFRGMLDPISGNVLSLPRPEQSPSALLGLDSDDPLGYSSFSAYPELPAKALAQRLCYYTLSCGTCLVRIVHIPTFYEKLEHIYEVPLDHLDQEDKHFVGLFFAVIALGCMYTSFDDSGEQVSYETAMDQGRQYYRHARTMLKDLTECRDVVSIQAMLYMILFQQATSDLSACYGYLGIALRSALRIGLHRSIEHDQMNPVQREIRRRVFYAIRQMDIYVSALLGFPLLLQADDIDQPFPAEIDDEFITVQGVIQPPPGTPSFFQAFNANTRLMETLHKITKYVYPVKASGQGAIKGNRPTQAYLISYSRIKEIETDLHGWFEKLPEAWRPSPDGPVEVVRVRHLLRFAYAHVQLVLYRPFIHYISPRLNQGAKVDELSYACAAAAVSVSRNIVHIGLEIRKQRVLSGPFWFMLYSEFFAVLTLIFYAVENPGKPGCAEVLADARAGRQMIAELSGKCMAAKMVTTALTTLFEQVPSMLEQGRARAIAAKQKVAGQPPKPNLLAQHQMGQVMSPQHSNDLLGAQNGLVANGGFGTPNSMGSLDQLSVDQFQDITFTGNMQDLYPMEVSSRATPESASSMANNFVTQGMAAQAIQNPVNKVDSLMFPSDDPFAYPNQPMMGLGFQSKGESSTAMVQDPSFFFGDGSLGDINQQFLDQTQQFLLQHQTQNGMGMTSNMFDHDMMLGLQANQPQAQVQQPTQPQIQQPQPPVPTPQISRQASQQSQLQRQASQQSQQSQRKPSQVQRPGTSQQATQTSLAPPQPQQRQQQRGRLGLSFFNRRPRPERQQERQQELQIEQIFTEHGMQADFGSFFGSGRGGFQGM